METPVFLPLLLGTNRQGRQSESVAKRILSAMERRDDITTAFFDVRNFALPADDYGQALTDRFPAYRDAITRADGLVIVTPEYNHGYPGTLKSVLDLLLREYARKAVGLVGVSTGPWGGTRAIEALVPVARELGLVPTSADLRFPNVRDAFDAHGNPTDPAMDERIGTFLDALVWMSRTLRWGREHLA